MATSDEPELAQLGYVATPITTSDRPGPWPGVVLVHDVFGLGDDMREQADWLAAAGYLVVIPDLFGGRHPVTCIRGVFAQLSAQRGPVFDQIDPIRAALAGLAGACPIVASFGGRDKSLAGAADKVQAAAARAGVRFDVKEYPQAGHGFINRLTAASPLSPLLRVAGVGYDHDAAADAKRRILAFFQTHLRGSGAPDPSS